MTLLVTGGAGFIGSNFVLRWFDARDEPIVNLDALTHGSRHSLDALRADARHRFVHGDIGDRALVGRLMDEHRPRAVVHFAAESHVDRSIEAPDRFIRANIDGTFALLEAVRRHWSALDAPARAAFRFHHVSTDEVYGSLEPDAAPFTEAHAYRPNNPYAASKAASDHLVRAWHHTYGLPVLTTNCSNNYGPRQFPDKLIPLVVVNALDAQVLPLYGDGANVRDWLYVVDHVDALVAVLERGQPGASYNIGGDSERTNLHVVQAVCDLLDVFRPRAGGSYRELIRFVPDRPGHDRRYAIDGARIRRELGWRPRERFETGLRKTVQWYLDHPQWLARIRSGAWREPPPRGGGA